MSKPLSPDRLQAFSDGVIAVIITIMVLELKVPTKDLANLPAIRQELPLVLVYLLSFIQTGIYWVNHHYLLDDAEQVGHAVLWSNLALLFALSLIPWATNWVAVRGISPFSIALYSFVCQLPAIAWIFLSTFLCRRNHTPTPRTSGKQLASALLYTGAIPLAYISPYISIAMILTVAILWLLPPRPTHNQASQHPGNTSPS